MAPLHIPHAAIRSLRRATLLTALATALGGCAYLGTVVTQADLARKQTEHPEQRNVKHMLDRETFFVFGTLDHAPALNPEAVAVIALSGTSGETVDVNHVAQPDSYYGLNLPAGDYRLLVVSDLDRDGFYDPTEVLGSRPVSLDAEATPGRVLSDYNIDLSARGRPVDSRFRVPVQSSAPLATSLFYPKGSLRSLDDPIFAPDMASLGVYAPASFMEAAPMMFYALEEDVPYKIPIVFVHGIEGSVRDFATIIAQLDRSRYKPWFFYYPSGNDLGQLGAMFYELFLSGSTIQLQQMPLVIVAHSMGGLVVREALNHLTGAPGENRIAHLVTIASPLGGHPGASSARHAPIAIPSWLDLAPDSDFIAGLHRQPLPPELDYHLLFAYADDRTFKTGGTSDGVVPLASQLSPPAQREATAQVGFDATHTGVLADDAAIREIRRIADTVRLPVPDAHLAVLRRGGFDVELGPDYSPMEAYLIHTLGAYLDALAAGEITPIDPAHAHFVRAIQGEVAPEQPSETAWIRFSRDYPDRSALARVPR
ncbi:MAG: DUF413 domain-containing protein [Rhodocyclaceae bacterium]|nr:DUF413 domain-containing protein [Rhodocyclaceae bacterium]MCB1954101.1 DUF413 domain-containing protein [Rhodocyclaceae bacterium]